MSTNEIIGKFLILASAINKQAEQEPENLLLQELAKDCQERFLTSIEYLSYSKKLFDNNLVFNNDGGTVLPTIKGWDKISNKTKVVQKLAIKPVEKMTNNEGLDTFVEAGYMICHRLQNDKTLVTKVNNKITDIHEMMECVISSVNKSLNVEETIQEEVLETV